MRYCLILLLLPPVTILRGQTDTGTITGQDHTFSTSHFGRIRPGMGPEEVLAVYDSLSFRQDTTLAPEGIPFPGYRLFPRTRAEAVVAFVREWGDERFSSFIQISRPDSPWRDTLLDIQIGTTLEELVRLNGAPLRFFTFTGTYGGMITDYHGGKLAGRYFLQLGIGEEDRIRLGDDDRSEISSTDPVFREVSPRLRLIGVTPRRN